MRKVRTKKDAKQINCTKLEYLVLIMPEGLKDVNPSPYPSPTEEINDHLLSLKAEFEKFKLSDYIELYSNETYAMFKHEYCWDRYLKPDLKKQCTKWCNDFNHANYALKKNY